MNRKGEEFTAARLIDVVKQHHTKPAAEISQAISRAVEAHRDGFPPNDDMTVVVLKMTT